MKWLAFASGTSMQPFLGLLNLCLVETKPPFVAVGDVVAFVRSKRSFGMIQHRVVDINRFGVLFIKGDNAPEIDTAQLGDIVFKLVKTWRLL